MANSFGNTINASATLNTDEAMHETMRNYINTRAKECVLAEKLELSKRAIDAGAQARTIIDKTVKALEAELNEYVAKHMDEIIKNKYEILHITELEARSGQTGYRNGQILAEIRSVVVFKRA